MDLNFLKDTDKLYHPQTFAVAFPVPSSALATYSCIFVADQCVLWLNGKSRLQQK
jgi:hypothetical protein